MTTGTAGTTSLPDIDDGSSGINVAPPAIRTSIDDNDDDSDENEGDDLNKTNYVEKKPIIV